MQNEFENGISFRPTRKQGSKDKGDQMRDQRKRTNVNYEKTGWFHQKFTGHI